ncbi:MAG: NAD(P)-dependent oxidoreductase [Synechococcaceae cyanobacterium]
MEHLGPGPERPPVGWVGLGALGAPMAANLLAAGFPLTVYNRSPGPEQTLVARGARAAVSPAAAAQAQLLCLCVSDDQAAREVLFGGGHTRRLSPDSAAAGLRAGGLVIDFSTIAPATSHALATRLADQGVAYLDAPVTGGTEGARAGCLSVLVGGAAADLDRARPLLEVVGNRISHLGPVGAGQQAKAVNQVLVAGSYAAVAEALALGRSLGLPMPRVCEALATGAAGSWALEHRAANMLQGHFPLGFRLALHRKDLGIALEAAASTGIELPLTRLVAAIEDELLDAGHGDDDVSAVARWFGSAARP